MTKIKKQADGKYYEKIVTWKKEPNYVLLFLGLMCLLLFFVFLILLIKASPIDAPKLIEDGTIHWFQFAMMLIGEVFMMLGTIIGFLILLMKSLGEGKKVKFERINS